MNALFAVQVRGKYGYINKGGHVVIEPAFDSAGPFYNGLACVKEQGRFGYIRVDGSYYIEPTFENAAAKFTNGFAGVQLKGLWGFVSLNGDTLVACQYHDVLEFQENLAAVCSGHKWGYVDSGGKLAVPVKYTSAERFSNELARVKIDDKIIFVDAFGHECEFKQFIDSGYYFSYGCVEVQSYNGLWGVVDKKQQCIIPCEYESVNVCGDDEVLCSNRDKFFYLSRDCSRKYGVMEFDHAYGFSSGAAPVRIGKQWHVLHPNGNLSRAIGCSQLSQFYNGYSTMVQANKVGLVDTHGGVVVPAQYDYLETYQEGYFRYQKRGEYGYIDERGNMIWSSKMNRV